ncbi:MAG: hypothetical protein HGA51_07680 [Demequinaceae bacterium]|nr:hypothetical protein [Demequinaceae bacterium]
MVNIYGRARPMEIGRARSRIEADLVTLGTTNEDLGAAHEAGKLEAVAQCLAVIGQVEGGFRADANGDSSHESFRTADILRELALMIRQEVVDPQTRSTLEVTARAEEAVDLSDYVIEVSTTYSSGNRAIAQALTHVAGDIRKGTDGVKRMRQAADVSTEPVVLGELVLDPDEDVRWWAAQNPATPVAALEECLDRERHHLVITALLNNPLLPGGDFERFAKHASPDVSRAASRRLKEASSESEGE